MKTFTFTHKGEEYTIPSFTSLPVGAIRKARKAKDEVDQAFTIIESVVDKDAKTLDAIDDMSMEEFQSFIQAWTQGVSVGESSSSSS